MRNIGLRISYDGSAFYGWQQQPGGEENSAPAGSPAAGSDAGSDPAGVSAAPRPDTAHPPPPPPRTVAGVLTDALQEFHGTPIKLTGASRTDAGVHAIGQYANFITPNTGIPADRFCYALNPLLPDDVNITASAEVPGDFHARYHARLRTYHYRLYPGPVLAHLRNYRLHIPAPLDLRSVNRSLSALVGTHDFCAFCQLPSPVRAAAPPVLRTITTAAAYSTADGYTITITATGFCRKMIRSIVGTVIDTRKYSPAVISRLLESKERESVGNTAPAHALYLAWIHYDKQLGLS